MWVRSAVAHLIHSLSRTNVLLEKIPIGFLVEIFLGTIRIRFLAQIFLGAICIRFLGGLFHGIIEHYPTRIRNRKEEEKHVWMSLTSPVSMKQG